MPRAAPTATLTLVAQSICGLPSPAKVYKNLGNTICSGASSMKHENPKIIKMKILLLKLIE
jgi:hypothetical protein